MGQASSYEQERPQQQGNPSWPDQTSTFNIADHFPDVI
jgi:hypothetical protein